MLVYSAAAMTNSKLPAITAATPQAATPTPARPAAARASPPGTGLSPLGARRQGAKCGGVGEPSSPAKHPPPLFDGRPQSAQSAGDERHFSPRHALVAQQAAAQATELLHSASNMQELRQQLLRWPASDASANMQALLCEAGGGGGGGEPLRHLLSNASNLSIMAAAPVADTDGRGVQEADCHTQQQQQQQRGRHQQRQQQRQAEQQRGTTSDGPTAKRRQLRFVPSNGEGGALPADGSSPEADAAARTQSGGDGGMPARRPMPMQLMAAHALSQLPGMRGSIRQVATLIKHEFGCQLDTSTPADAAQPRWKDALVGVFKSPAGAAASSAAPAFPYLTRTPDADNEGHSIYALLPERLPDAARAGLAALSGGSPGGPGSSGASAGGSAPTPAAAGAPADALGELTEVISQRMGEVDGEQELVVGNDHASSEPETQEEQLEGKVAGPATQGQQQQQQLLLLHCTGTAAAKV